MPYKKIIAFDFDRTLIHTMEPEEGRKIWLREKCEEFPHPTGWWSKKESMDMSVFYPTMNMWTHEKYLEAISEKDNYVFIATGRIDKLKKEVQAILDFHDLKFHDVFCNCGSETYRFKTKLFESLIKKNTKATEFILYDDRYEHLVKFVEWAEVIEKNHKIKVTIIDVVNKKQLY